MEPLWTPTSADLTDSQLARFARRVGFEPSDYAGLQRWSTSDLDGFWRAVWEWFGISDASGEATGPALADDAMPGARWFPDAELNYADVLLRLPGRADDDVVLVGYSQTRDTERVTAAGLRDLVARVRGGLVAAGVGIGDHVATCLPACSETLAIQLAAASLGASYSSCPPELGERGLLERWRLTEPKVVVTADGYRYGDKYVDRSATVLGLLPQLPSVEQVVWLPYAGREIPDGVVTFADFTAHADHGDFARVPFDHPLVVLFSSGTTGPPKAIVHSHGGITLEHLKALGLHLDLGPTDTFCWFTTTGWMMWNFLVSGLAVGSTIVLFDGNPLHPSLGRLFEVAAQEEVTYLGLSASFLSACTTANLQLPDLPALRGLGSTGSPLPAPAYDWVYSQLPQVQLGSMSGGTDVCTAFIGSSPTVPVWRGELSAAMLGCAVDCVAPDGSGLVEELGELVVRRPMPSMPIGFVGDPTGERFRAAYFEDYPGLWRHGDWVRLTERGSFVITGRSDATLNRGGVRLGTADFYDLLDSIPEISDSLVVHLEANDERPEQLIVLVVADPAYDVSGLRARIRDELSPRHVPDRLVTVEALPRTLTGKRLEVPLKKVLLGGDPTTAVNLAAVNDPRAVSAIAEQRSGILGESR